MPETPPRPRRRITYANVVATVALFLTLTAGSAWAATIINGKNLKNNSVTRAKIARNTLSGDQIAERTLSTVPSASTLVGGLGPTAFERSTRIQYGQGITTAPAVSMFAWPELGFDIRTDGDADNEGTVVVANILPVGGANLKVSGVNSGNEINQRTIAPGQLTAIGGVNTSLLDFIVSESINQPQGDRAIHVTCTFNNTGTFADNRALCFGVRSNP